MSRIKSNIINFFKRLKNKQTITMLIAVLTLLIFIIGSTYAYFTAQNPGQVSSDVNIMTNTTDRLSFSFGDVINIYATEENFAEGMPNLSDSTTATAALTANNYTNSVTTRYNIYLIIEDNDFEYTTETQTPELLLKVIDPNGNEVKNINGLVYYEDGFDITTRTGGFLLVPDYIISANETPTVQDWIIEITFVNLDTDQNANTNKTLTGKLYLTQDQMSTYVVSEINSVDVTTTHNSIDIALDLTNGSASASKYYYGISSPDASEESVTYIESDSPNHSFTGLDPNTEYKIYSYIVDENNITSNVYSTTISTDNYNLPTVTSVESSVTLTSITLTVESSGSSNITQYMYSKDDGLTWEESTLNTYTFTDLTDSTEYKIRVKVIDSEGYTSAEYYDTITTEIYILPVVANVNAETTYNSITLTPEGTDGTGSIVSYLYSINDGEYQENNTFTNLNESTEYTIKIKAIDSNNRESIVKEIVVTTDAYILPTVDNLSFTSTDNTLTISATVTAGDGQISTYHFSRDDGSNYTVSSSNEYTFTNLTSNTNYYIKVYVTDSNNRTSIERTITAYTIGPHVTLATNNASNTYHVSTPASLSCANATASYSQKYQRIEISAINNRFTNCTLTYSTPSSRTYLNNYVISLAGTTQGSGQVVNENGYRYEGQNPNNYVWFNNELWRIIGVFDSSSHGQSGQNLVKLIKADSIGGISWHSENINNWATSNLYNLLNNEYLNSTDGTWGGNCYSYLTSAIPHCNYTNTGIKDSSRDMIANVTWYLGGAANPGITVERMYSNERSSSVYSGNATTVTGKIGLMYASDYGYAVQASNCSRSTQLYNYSTAACTLNNWIYGEGYEWTITTGTTNASYVYFTPYTGFITYTASGAACAVRPVLYLNSNVYLISGTGSENDPFIIGM